MNLKLNCVERREMERQIRECLFLVTRLCNNAVELASSGQAETRPKFNALQFEISTNKARLRTLHECLDIHRRLHGC